MMAGPLAMVPRGAPLPVLLPVRRPAPRTLTLPLDAGWPRRTMLAVVVLLALWLMCAEALAQAGMARPGILAALWKWTPVIFHGFLFNIVISVLSMAIGTAAGVVLGLLQVSLITPVRRAAWAVTQFFRNAPWLVILFYCILLIPFQLTVFGIVVPFPAWVKAVIGLSLPVMAYVSEFVRGAVRSIPSGQWEAAESLAFSRFQTMTMVILPQCVKRLLPPWMNLYAILTMATPLVSIVGVQEAMTLTRAALSSEGRFDLLIPMYLYILMWFFLYCYPISQFTVRLERRYGRAS
jgi:polar amino acid transport system permease protein